MFAKNKANFSLVLGALIGLVASRFLEDSNLLVTNTLIISFALAGRLIYVSLSLIYKRIQGR